MIVFEEHGVHLQLVREAEHGERAGHGHVLTEDPQGFYRRGSASIEHALTKVIFAKLYLDMRDAVTVSSHDLTDGLSDLSGPRNSSARSTAGLTR